MHVCGNVVVLKLASYSRLTALLFAEICAEVGRLAGIFNAVTGPGSFGQALATHPLVDKVGFTGKGENRNRTTFTHMHARIHKLAQLHMIIRVLAKTVKRVGENFFL